MLISRASLLRSALLTSFVLPAAAAEISFNTPALSTAEITTAGNWVGGLAPGSGDIAAWKTDGDPLTAGTQESRGGTLTIASPVSWLGLRHEDSVGALTLTGSDITLGSSGITEVRWETLTIQNNVVLNGNQTWTNSAALNVSGIVSGSFSITKSGTGTLTLSGANTYSGGTTLSSGVISLGSAGALGSTGTLSMNGGSLQFTAANTTDYSSRIRLEDGTTSTFDTNSQNVTFANALSVGTLGTGGLIKSGGGTLTLSGANTFGGPVTVANGSLAISSLNRVSGGTASSNLGAPTTVANGTISLGGGGSQGTLVYRGTGETTDRVINLSGTSGGATITQDGTGLLRFTSATTVTGSGAKGVTLNGNGNGEISGFASLGGLTNLTKSGLGTWTLTGASSQGGGAVNVNGGILAYTATASRTSGTFTRSATGGGVLEIAAGSNIITSTANTSGILGGWATYGDTTWAVANGASAISGLATFATDTWAAGNNTDVTLAGANPATDSTTHSLRFNDAGAKTLTLAGINTLTSGGLMVTSGVGANLTTITGGTLVGANTADLIVHQNNTLGGLTIASIIANNTGATGLTKTGSGNLTLSGANTYTGTTRVLEGKLTVTGNNGSKVYEVGNQGTLELGYSTGNSVYGYGVTVAGAGTSATTGLYLNGGISYTFQSSLRLSNAPTTVRTFGSGSATLAGWDSNGTHLAVEAAASGSVMASTINFTPGSYGYVMNIAAGANTANGDVTFQGLLTGATNGNSTHFRKNGAGSLALSGASTNTAPLNIWEGSVILTGGNNRLGASSTVALGNGTTSGKLLLDGIGQTLVNLSTSGSGTANAVVGKSATLSTLTLNYTGAGQTYTGTLGGSGTHENNLAFTKTGSGTYTLSGTNTYTGGTTFSGGLLSLGSSGALGTSGTLSMNGGGLQFTTANTTDYSSRITLVDGTTSVFDTNGQSVTFASALGLGSLGTGGFTKSGLGTLVLSGSNTYTGATTAAAGTLALSGADNRLLSTNSLVLGSGSSGGTLRLDGISQTLASITTSGSGTNRVTGGSATLSSLVINNTAAVSFGGILGGSDPNENNLSLTKTGAGTLTLSGANTFTGGTTLTAGTLSFANGSLGSVAMNGGTLQWNGANTQDLSSLIALVNAKAAIFDTNGNNVTFASSIGSTTTGSLVKTGNGTLSLSAANTYSGSTTINAGTLSISADNQLGTAPAATAAAQLVINGGVFSVTSGFTLDSKRGIAVGPGTGSGSGTISVASGQTLNYGGIVANNGGTGSLIKAGDGTLVLSGAGSWTGTGVVNAGTLEVLAKTTNVNYTVAQGATLKLGYSSGGGYTAAITVNGNGVSDAAGLYLKGGINYQTQNGLLLQTAATTVRSYGTGNATHQGFDVNGNYFLRSTAEASGSVIDSTINLNTGSYGYKVQADLGANTGTGDLTIKGVISGTGNAQVGGEIIATGLDKRGTGSLVLTAANTYSAGTSINDGAIILTGGNNRLPATTAVALGNGSASGRLLLDGVNQTVTDLLVNGTGTNNRVAGNSATTSTLTVNYSGSGRTFSGVIGGSGTNENNLNLAKAGAGTLTLSNSSTYTGTTSVNAGTLIVNGSLGNTAVTVADNATLGGSGTIAGSVVFQDGSTHTPGTSPGLPTLGTATYETGSVFQWELVSNTTANRGTAYDGVNVTNALTVGTGALFDIILNGSGSAVNFTDAFWAESRSWNVFTASSLAGLFTLGNVSTDSAGNNYSSYGSFTFTGSGGNLSLEWSAVPEPSSALGGLLLAAAMLRRRR